METVDLKAMGERVWETLQDVEAFLEEIPEGKPREVFGEFVRNVPELLKEQLDEKITFASLLKAKLTIVKATLEGDFLERLFRAYPEDAMPFSVDVILEMATSALSALIPSVEDILNDVPAYMVENGVTEEQILSHPKAGRLNRKSMAAYRAGTLTVGELLELQPWIIIKNSE